jgi:hypothetical protein
MKKSEKRSSAELKCSMALLLCVSSFAASWRSNSMNLRIRLKAEKCDHGAARITLFLRWSLLALLNFPLNSRIRNQPKKRQRTVAKF